MQNESWEERIARERRECCQHNQAVEATLLKRKAGRPLSEYEAKIVGPNGYRWIEASPGVFVTSPLGGPITAEQWNEWAAKRNPVNAARVAEYARKVEAERKAQQQ